MFTHNKLKWAMGKKEERRSRERGGYSQVRYQPAGSFLAGGHTGCFWLSLTGTVLAWL